MKDLIELFNNLGTVLPAATNLVYVFIGLAGVFFFIMTMFDGYQHAMGEHSARLASKASIPFRLMLSGAMVVAPLLLWRAANTFVLGGNKTYDMFSYKAGNENTPYCELFHHSLAYFFMFMGSVAIACSAVIAYGISNGRSNSGSWKPVVLFIGGVCLFFIDDVGLIIGNSLKMDITLDAICANLTKS